MRHDLAQHGLARPRAHVPPTGQHGQAEQHGPEDHPEQQLGPLGPDHPGLLEERHPVGDGLHPGEGAAARGEGLQHEQDADRLQPVGGQQGAAGQRLRAAPSGWIRPTTMMASSPTMNTIVGRRKARAVSPRPRRLRTVMTARMPRQSGTVAADEAREGRGQRPHAGGDRHGDGERVVDDQRGPGHQAGARPEVGPGHGVGPAAARVGVDDLAVGEDEDGQQDDDGHGDRQDQVQGPRPGEGQHDDDRLGAVGDRGQRVEGECGKPLDRGDLLLRGSRSTAGAGR